MRFDPQAGEPGRRAARWFLIPLALWAAVVLPSVHEPAWGSLDDGMTLTNAARGVILGAAAGRMIPLYWAHNWLLFQLGGLDPRTWYAIQAGEMLLLAGLLFVVVWRVTRRGWAAALASGNVFLSSPIAENVTTISKQEPRVALAVVILALALVALLRTGTGGGLRGAWPWVGVAAAALLLAFLKESAVAAVALGVAGTAVSTPAAGTGGSRHAVRRWGGATVVLALAVGTMLVLRALSLKGAEADYLADRPSLLRALMHAAYVAWQWPDVLLTGAAALALGFAAFFRLRAGTSAETRSPDSESLALALGWGYLAYGGAYLALVIAWRGPAGYHLLPVVTCLSLALGCLAGVVAAGRAGRGGLAPVLVLALGLVLAGKLYATPYIHYIASAQRLFDRSEWRIQERMLARPITGRIVDFDRAWFTEPPVQRTLLFGVLGHPDRRWVGAGELLRPYDPAERARFPPGDPDLERSPLRPGEIVVVQGVDYPFALGLRGVGPGGFAPVAALPERVAAIRERTGRELSLVARVETARRVFAPWTLRPARLAIASWVLRAEATKGYSISWEGSYGDWIGPRAALTVRGNGKPVGGELRIRMLDIPAVLPIEVRLAGARAVRVALSPGDLEERVPLRDLLPPGGGRILIETSRGWRPRDVLPGSEDDRLLGVQVFYEP